MFLAEWDEFRVPLDVSHQLEHFMRRMIDPTYGAKADHWFLSL
jgi:hypothetical protein